MRSSKSRAPVASKSRAPVAVVALLSVSLLAAACGSSAPTSAHPKSTTFTYWTSGFSTSEISTVDAAFNKSHPGMHVTGQYIAKSDQFLPKVVAALKTGTEPTIVLDQNASDLPLYAQSGKLVPLNGKLSALTAALYPGIRKFLFYRGKQLGMALSGAGDLVLFYNKTDFAKAGIAGPPRTWSQLQADAAKLTSPAAHRYGIYIPTGNAEWISFDWETLLWANGGHLLNASQTKAAFDSAAGIKALTTWVDMVRKTHVAPSASFAQGGNFDGSPAFASNVVAMLVDGQWDLSTFKSAGVNFGVAQLPRGTAGRATNIGIGVAALFHKTSAKEAAGLSFIKWLASPAEGAYLAATSGGLPSSAAQLQQPLLKKYVGANPDFATFAAAEQSGHVRPITPAYNAVSQALWTGINAALSGSASPSAALATAAAKADSALKSQGP
ncbi:MAG: ABC transporter substrate-binding protein [Acidimicrobiales bacterium]